MTLDHDSLPEELVRAEDAEDRAKPPAGFDRLVENAIDFLKKGISEIKESPKDSVIHFCTGIELLIKARLLHEHWSLVVTKPGEVTKQQFVAGDFQSVTMDQCLSRIENICEENLAEERKGFKAIANHRNRVVHFYHEAYAGAPDPKLLESIAIQQLVAGALLMQLVRERWRLEFETYRDEFREIEHSLRDHKQYLSAKFQVLKSELQKFTESGGKVRACFFCGMESALVVEDGPPRQSTHCLVCEWRHHSIIVECPECKDGTVEFDAGHGTCNACDEDFDIDLLLEEYGPANWYCPECSYTDEETVVERGDRYLCLACGTDYDRAGSCGFCNEDVAGDTSDSYLIGCMFCDGYIGWHKDD